MDDVAPPAGFVRVTAGRCAAVVHVPFADDARAFAGQLVPQNPTDEPAKKLLERIKAEKG